MTVSRTFFSDLSVTNLRSVVCNCADDNTLYCCKETTENVLGNLQSDLKVC